MILKGSVGTLASILKEYEQIREFFTSATLVSIIDMPFACIFLFFIWYVGGHMVIPVIVGIILLISITLLMQPRLKRLSESAQEEAHDKHSVLVETLSGLETVKLLGAGGLLRKRFKSVVTQQAKSADETKKHTFFYESDNRNTASSSNFSCYSWSNHGNNRGIWVWSDNRLYHSFWQSAFAICTIGSIVIKIKSDSFRL